jgi:hypothetical protein
MSSNAFEKHFSHWKQLIFLLTNDDNNKSIDFDQGKSQFLIEVQDELWLFIDKKVIFDIKKSVGSPSAVCQQIRMIFFPFNVATF